MSTTDAPTGTPAPTPSGPATRQWRGVIEEYRDLLDIPADTNVITLPLGIDELVTLTRTPTEHVREDAVLSRKRTYQQGYTIEFFNQRRTQVELLVEDQIPLSAGAAAKVTLLETVPPADHDAATGTLTWELSLKPAERRQLRVDYEVEAGRGVHVVRE